MFDLVKVMLLSNLMLKIKLIFLVMSLVERQGRHRQARIFGYPSSSSGRPATGEDHCTFDFLLEGHHESRRCFRISIPSINLEGSRGLYGRFTLRLDSLAQAEHAVELSVLTRKSKSCTVPALRYPISLRTVLVDVL